MELGNDFEEQVRESMLEQARPRADALAEKAIEASHDRLESVASANGYDVENVIDSLEGPDVTHEDDRIIVEWGWTHEAAHLFNVGTPDHQVSGNETLSFIWEDAPAGIVEEFGDGTDQDPRVFFQNVEVSGIERSSFVREGLRSLEAELQE